MADPLRKDGLSLIAGDRTNRKADLVFIHGFMGDAQTTWESQIDSKDLWPKWLADDFPGLAVWSYGYESTVIHWLKDDESLESLATNALACLQANDLGQRPLLFVTHSLGGIVVKHLIDVATASSKSEYAHIAQKICGIEFIAVPHSGAKFANHWLELIRLIWAKEEKLERIRWGSDALSQLHIRFDTFRQKMETSLYLRSLYERNPLSKKVSVFGVEFTIRTPMIVVDKVSADLHFPEFMPLEIDEDHIGICKPTDRSHNTYVFTKEFVRQSLIRTKVSMYNDQVKENDLSEADRDALIESLMGPKVKLQELGKCSHGGQTQCGVRSNSVLLVSELNQTMAATFETQRFLDHCNNLFSIALRIRKSLDEDKQDHLSQAVRQLWAELGYLVSFFKNLVRCGYKDSNGGPDDWSDRPCTRMANYYERRVLYDDDARNRNATLKPLLRDLAEVYDKLREMDEERKDWSERVRTITTDDKYLRPVMEFAEHGIEVIQRLEGLRDGRFIGTAFALEHGFASQDLSDLTTCFGLGINEMPHTKSTQIPRPRKDNTKS